MGALPTYLASLATTVAIEAAVASLLAPRGKRQTVVLTSVFLNLTSHSLATLLMWLAHARFLVLELAILVGEVLGYHCVARTTVPRSIAIAGVANLLTAALSLVWWGPSRW